MNRITSILAFFVLFTGFAKFTHGQNELYDTPLVVYDNMMFGRAFIHSNGFGAGFTYGKFQDPHHIRSWGVELLTIKHEKEHKRYNDYYDYYKDAKGFVYGKLNSFFLLRPTMGRRIVITDKLRFKGVEFGHHFEFGPSVGFTKPVYLEIATPNVNLIDAVLSIEKYDPDVHDLNEIYGRASNFRGFNELSVHPGLHFKYGLNFDYSNYKDGIKGLEIGVALDAYLNEIEIMAEDVYGIGGAENKQLFVNLYLNFFFGRKSSI